MRILMPINNSASSKQAVAFIASRATLLKAPTNVRLFNIQYPIPTRAARALGKEMVKAHHEREASELLRSPTSQLKRAGATASGDYLIGTVEPDLVDVVRNDPADLVVVGSRGDSGFAHLFWGSVAETVATCCNKPLLILRGQPVPKRDNLKVALALDGSKYGIAAAKFLAKYSALLGEKPTVTLLHVAPELSKVKIHGWIDREVDTGILPKQVEAMHNAAFEAVFQPARDVLLAAGILPKEARLVGNDAGATIAAYATKNKLDLIAMGSLGFGSSRFSPVGSTANRVASRARTPLLLVRDA